MKTSIIMLSIILSVGSVSAEEVLKAFDWATLSTEGDLKGGEQAQGVLTVRNDQSRPRTIRILDISNPGITRPRYGMIGEIKYEDVEGKGYLEMWNYFPGDKAYFSRTLAPSGALAGLSGSSAWRPFCLPFINHDGALPIKIEWNLVLPGRGMVRIRNVRLVQYGENEDPITATHAWWSPRQAGLYGGLLGALIGCLGALLGWLSSKGRARGFVLGITRTLIVFGIASFLLGFVAVLFKQPYAVYYPLLLLGGLCAVLPVGLLKRFKKIYEQAELRRMHAADAM